MDSHATERLLLVSSDGHCGPSLEHSLRQYCPQAYLEQFDDFVMALREGQFAKGNRKSELGWADVDMQRKVFGPMSGVSEDVIDEEVHNMYAGVRKDEREMYLSARAHDDPNARLDNMDDDGVAAEVIFAGGQNLELSPFIGFGSDGGGPGTSAELRLVGSQIWNRWLASYVAKDPARLIGVAQIPVWDIPEAIKEIRQCHAEGLKVVNFPAPRPDFLAYNHDEYEPLWEICEELAMPLSTHATGSEAPAGFGGRGWDCIRDYEKGWLTRRALQQLIYGGVFERHPDLKFILTELRGGWVPETLKHLDDTYRSYIAADVRKEVPRLPSDYWASNCYNSGSFLARFEVQALYDHSITTKNQLWGRDYPHFEGTWPNTALAIRNSLGGFPEDDVVGILGRNAIEAFNLDSEQLWSVAQRIGPTISDVGNGPLTPDEIPKSPGFAFRQWGEND